jgi:hypothetical protein
VSAEPQADWTILRLWSNYPNFSTLPIKKKKTD